MASESFIVYCHAQICFVDLMHIFYEVPFVLPCLVNDVVVCAWTNFPQLLKGELHFPMHLF